MKSGMKIKTESSLDPLLPANNLSLEVPRITLALLLVQQALAENAQVQTAHLIHNTLYSARTTMLLMCVFLVSRVQI
jgi:hypothetical protein